MATRASDRIADEQAALRRVATLVVRAASPEEVLAGVAGEVGRLLEADFTVLSRYHPGGVVTVLGLWSSAGAAVPVSDTRTRLGGQNLATLVFRTGRPTRIDDYAGASGAAADLARGWGFRSAVGVPISVDGRLWGVMLVASTREPLPAAAKDRLAGFTELAATAIANAEAQAALAASRARIVATADATRRRIERDLHDGAQQHLVTLALQLRAAQEAAPPEAGVPVQQLDEVAIGLTEVLEELREIARGLHPATLAQGGLRPALQALARRSAADVEVATDEGVLRVCVHDDGCGGADVTGGSGLVGLWDRIEALGGRISLHSPPGEGTTLQVQLPVGQVNNRSTASGTPSLASVDRLKQPVRGQDPGPGTS